jgi:hypothetical protein
MIFFLSFLRKRYLGQNIPLKKRMLPFGDFPPKKKETSTQHNWQANI